MKKQEIDVAVIGGGAAGMMAAAVAAGRGLSVVIFEHNEYTGKKLRITGKGRCNLTNNCPVRGVLENVPCNSRFLYSAMNGFPPEKVMEWFESLGVPLVTERGGRVFPVSQKAADVVSALRRELSEKNVPVLCRSVSKILTEGNKVTGVVADSQEFSCRNVILCTGGMSYPLTGSRGDGYKMAEKLGHTIIPPKPSLVPLECREEFCRDMQGLSLKNITLSVYNSKNKLLYSDLGEMLFTHFGVSGPLVLSASAHMRNFEKDSYYGKIDLKPGLDEKKLDARLLRDFEKYQNRDIMNALGELLHKRMIKTVVESANIPAETKVNSLTKLQRKNLLNTIKGLKITFTAPRPIEEAIITSGGISVKEISPGTMESKKTAGLYFAGEIIDVDAYTGGFNLQIAWATAYAAGNSVGI